MSMGYREGDRFPRGPDIASGIGGISRFIGIIVVIILPLAALELLIAANRPAKNWGKRIFTLHINSRFGVVTGILNRFNDILYS